MNVYEKIEAQRKGKEYTDVWMVGQQLMDMLRRDPSLEEIVDKDLEVNGMGLADCAKKIKAWADEKHKEIKSRAICVPPDVAEGIIREFYGLPGAEASETAPVAVPAPAQPEDDSLDFSDFL